jgi:hypothetical protein
MDYDMFIPITAFLSLAAVIGLFSYFRFRARFEVHKTVRAAIERGQLMTPEFLERLGDAHHIPFLVGLAFVGLWKFAPRRRRASVIRGALAT